MRIVHVLILLIYILQPACGQGEIEEQEKIFYRNERTIAFLLNSNGMAANFRYAKRIDAFKKTTYEVELANIKHPKEERLSTNTYPASGSFVYGKTNLFINLRGGIGLQNEIFRKRDRGGISIRYFYNVGPAIGFLKPIYYKILYYDNNNPTGPGIRKIEKFETSNHTSTGYIEGKASFFKGFDELSVVPGAYGKIGFTFEFSKFDEVFHAIETGIIFDAFLKKMPIMAVENDSRFFFALFVSYRFGKVIDAQFRGQPDEIDKILLE